MAALFALLLWLSPSLAPPPAAASQHVTFRTGDGVTLSGTWYEPSGRAGPAVVMVHMLQRSRRDYDALANRVAAEGIGVLTFDLRGHGESGGSPEPLSAMVADVRAARRFVATRGDVIGGRVGLLGASVGANLAVLAAESDPGVACLALLSPSLDYRGLRIEAPMRRLSGIATLLVASDDDPYAMRSVRDLEKTGKSREVLRLTGVGHGTTMLNGDSGLSAVLVDWFRRTLL